MNVFASDVHYLRPLKFGDVMSAMVTLAGASIAATFAFAILAMAAGLVFTAAFAVVQWLARLM